MSAPFDPGLSKALEAFRISSLPPEFYYIPDFITVEEEEFILRKIPAQRWVTLSHRRLQAHPSTLTKQNVLLGAPLPSYLTTPVVGRFKALGIFNHTPHKEPNHVLINEYKKGEGIMPHEDGGAYAEVVATVSLGATTCLELQGKPSEDRKEPDESEIEVEIEIDEARNKGNTNTPEEDAPFPGPKYRLPTRILQEPRSLLVTIGPAYRDLLHGIASVDVDENLNRDTVANWDLLAHPEAFADGRNERGTRVSLTYRDVLKVSTAASKVLGGFGRR